MLKDAEPGLPGSSVGNLETSGRFGREFEPVQSNPRTGTFVLHRAFILVVDERSHHGPRYFDRLRCSGGEGTGKLFSRRKNKKSTAREEGGPSTKLSNEALKFQPFLRDLG